MKSALTNIRRLHGNWERGQAKDHSSRAASSEIQLSRANNQNLQNLQICGRLSAGAAVRLNLVGDRPRLFEGPQSCTLNGADRRNEPVSLVPLNHFTVPVAMSLPYPWCFPPGDVPATRGKLVGPGIYGNNGAGIGSTLPRTVLRAVASLRLRRLSNALERAGPTATETSDSEVLG